MKKYYIPEQARDRIRACIGAEDSQKFRTCKEVSDLWIELGPGIIYEKARENNWKPREARGKAHRWFLSSLAADAGLGYQSMLNRQRVGDSWIARGYLGGENENVSYQKVVCLHANAEKGEDGLILKSVLDDRLKWFHDVADNHGGQPPSVLDIQNEFRKNGEQPEWKILWKQVVRISKKLKELDETPNLLRQALYEILRVKLPSSNADADFTGGKEKGKKAVGSASTSRKYDVPTVIYKGEGFTGAQKEQGR